MELTQGVIGEEGSYALKFEGGKVLLEASHVHASGKVSFVIEQDAEYFMDKLAEAIPGKIDDAILALLKGAVKAV
jgi:hypothetical protein